MAEEACQEARNTHKRPIVDVAGGSEGEYDTNDPDSNGSDNPEKLGAGVLGKCFQHFLTSSFKDSLPISVTVTPTKKVSKN